MNDQEINDLNLIDTGSVSTLFGVSRQRLGQMADEMPRPVYKKSRVTTLWARNEIIDWGKRNGYIERY